MTLPPDYELLCRRLSYDPSTGVFVWLNPVPGTRAKAGGIAGSMKTDGYVRISVERKEFLAHRAAWIMHFKAQPPRLIDHVNANRSDNRIANLRSADHAENNWNSYDKLYVKGCGKHNRGSTYYALIRHRGRRIYLGTFATEALAQAAYHEAAKNLRGGFYDSEH